MASVDGPNIPVPDAVLDAVRAMTDPNMKFHIRPTSAVRQAVNASFTSVKVSKLEANVGYRSGATSTRYEILFKCIQLLSTVII